MPDDLPATLCRTWARPGAPCRQLATGENETWQLGDDLVVRLYRPGRRTPGQVAAEWAWADALSPEVSTPRAVPGADGERLQHVDGRIAVAMAWCPGAPLRYHDLDRVEALGRLAGTLRRRADEVIAGSSADWLGWDRPHIDPVADLDAQVRDALQPSYATEAQARRLRQLAGELAARLDEVPLEHRSWIHADLHGFNVLDDGERLTVIDLDDAVFGPVAVEWATPRIHLRAFTDLDASWPRFAAGVASALGAPPDEDEVRVGTAVHLISTMAEFPAHLDMPQLADPGVVLDRYLGYLEAELDG
jgi:Ser/Thr protein kinase RdoA (MazF antagonist)